MENSTNVFGHECPGAAVVWHVAASELGTRALGEFLHTAKRGIAGSQCYNLEMGQAVCCVLVQLSPGLCCQVDRHDFACFIVGWAFDFALAYLAYCSSAEVDWSSIDGVHHWFLYGFVDACVQDLVETLVPSRRRDGIRALGADILYTTRSVA